MRSILLVGAALAGSLWMSALTQAQQALPSGFSTYGYTHQDVTADNDPTPNWNSPVQSAVTNPMTLETTTYSSIGDVECDTLGCDAPGCDAAFGSGGCGNGSEVFCGIGECGTCGGRCKGKCLIGSLVRSTDRNVVVGVRALVFERDYEDDIRLGSNGSGVDLFSTDVNHDWFAGLEATISSRACTGCGWQLGYWGLLPKSRHLNFGGAPLSTTLGGLENLDLPGTTTSDVFNSADSWSLSRDTEIHNFEFNLLRNGGSVSGPLCRCFNLEWLGGTRWLSVQEELGITTSGSSSPGFTRYDVQARNHLFGLQLGARLEGCIRNRWTATLGSKFGVYYNDISSEQGIQDEAGNVATINNGNGDLAFSSGKSDIATLGELDAGLNYQLNASTRANFGYRIMGISGVALAANQIPNDFTDVQDAARIKSNSGMLLHGFYFGLERAF